MDAFGRSARRTTLLFGTLLALTTVVPSAAASPAAVVPTLIADGYEGSAVLELTSLEVDVRIRGHLSRTSYVATFRNHASMDLNGRFFLPLPGDATVSDLGLFFDGKLRRAVSVERERARIAYEDIVHRAVDPVLAEWSEGSGFRYEVYPIPANGDKQVFIAFDQELARIGDRLVYQLDLRSLQRIGRLTLSIDSDDGSSIEILAGPHTRTGVTSLETFAEDVQLEHLINVSSEAREEALSAWSESDRLWYHSRPVRASRTSAEVARASELVVFVDVSGSADSHDEARVLDFLDALLRRQEPLVRVTMYPFHSELMPGRVIRSSPAGFASHQLRELVGSLERTGASSYSRTIAQMADVIAGLSSSSRVILIGDGISTIGSSDSLEHAMARLPRTHPITVVTASSDCNYTTLGEIVSATGGWLVPLLRLSPVDAVTSVMHRPGRLEFAAGNPAVVDLVPARMTVLAGEQSYLAARSTTPDFSSVEVRGTAAVVTIPESRILDEDDVDLLRSFWARRKLDALMRDPETSDERLALHGKEFRLLTPRTSLLVLEDPRDYLMFDIPLPEDLAPHYESMPAVPDGGWGIRGRVMFEGGVLPGVAVRATAGELTSEAISDSGGMFWLSFHASPQGPVTLTAAMEGMDRFSRTWENLPHGATVELEMHLASISEAITVTESAPASSPVSDVGQGSGSARWGRSECDVCSRLLDDAMRSADLQLSDDERSDAEWLVRRDWIARIIDHFRTIRDRDERMRFYAEARGRLQGSRVFHVRLAEAMRPDDPQMAVRILLDLAEGEAANAPLLRILGQLLEGWGEVATARQLYERAIETGAQHPQSWRNLIRLEAASGRRGRVAELMRRYPLVEPDHRFREPAELLAEELSHLETNDGVARSAVYDPMTDLRIEASWDSNFNYVDLWVTEPDGRVVEWNRPRGTGTMRFFMTDGYGPQVYEVRDAPSGDYEVHVDFYSEDVTEVTREPMAHVVAWRRNDRGGWDREDRIVFLSAEETRPHVMTIPLE